MTERKKRTEMNVKQNEKPVLRDDKGRWLPGSGSPSPGRPMSSRHRISERLLADLADVWEKRGAEVLERLANDDPGKLAQIAYGLLPRDIFIQVQQSGSPETAHQRALLRSVLDAIEEHEPNAQPEILEEIREYLRARNAKEIGSSGSKAVAIDSASEGKTEFVQELKYVR